MLPQRRGQWLSISPALCQWLCYPGKYSYPTRASLVSSDQPTLYILESVPVNTCSQSAMLAFIGIYALLMETFV